MRQQQSAAIAATKTGEQSASSQKVDKQLNADNAATPVRRSHRSHTSLHAATKHGHPTCRNAARPSHRQRSCTSPNAAGPGRRGQSTAQFDRGTRNRDVNRVKHKIFKGYIQIGRSEAVNVECCVEVSEGEGGGVTGRVVGTVVRRQRTRTATTGANSRNRRPNRSPEEIEASSERDSWSAYELKSEQHPHIINERL